MPHLDEGVKRSCCTMADAIAAAFGKRAPPPRITEMIVGMSNLKGGRQRGRGEGEGGCFEPD